MRATLHEKRCLDVLHSQSVREFKTQIVSFVQDIGFSTFGAMVVTDHSPTLREIQLLQNAPEAYVETFRDRKLTIIDPVLQHCKHSSSPIVWDRNDYDSAALRALWEGQEPFGYRSGLAIGMHFPRGKHFVFGANWEKDSCGAVRHFKEIAEDLLAFAQHAQAAAFELVHPVKPNESNTWSASNAELEALRWSMDGLTTWETANRMSISERHVTLLIRNLLMKLGCSNKYEAGLRAIRFGLIQCN